MRISSGLNVVSVSGGRLHHIVIRSRDERRKWFSLISSLGCLPVETEEECIPFDLV